MSGASRLLYLTLPHVRTHGFTREALARSVLDLPPPETHSRPLSDTAVSALFGTGDLARKTLIRAWLDEGICDIQRQPTGLTLKEILHTRLRYNEPVLEYLPEAFSLLASPTSGLPLLDPRAAATHAFKIADEACYVTGDASLQLAWYARRGTIAAIYTAAELHQLTSPKTAHDFLDSLFEGTDNVKRSLTELKALAYSNPLEAYQTKIAIPPIHTGDLQTPGLFRPSDLGRFSKARKNKYR